MENLTYAKIISLKNKILSKTSVDKSRLKGYRYVDELHELKIGGYVRWINVEHLDKLMAGGFVVRIDIEDDGTRILCKNRGRLFQFWMDECIVFQKITPQEHIIFIANEY